MVAVDLVADIYVAVQPIAVLDPVDPAKDFKIVKLNKLPTWVHVIKSLDLP